MSDYRNKRDIEQIRERLITTEEAVAGIPIRFAAQNSKQDEWDAVLLDDLSQGTLAAPTHATAELYRATSLAGALLATGIEVEIYDYGNAPDAGVDADSLIRVRPICGIWRYNGGCTNTLGA